MDKFDQDFVIEDGVGMAVYKLTKGSISIQSRKNVERQIARHFPNNTAVICFYDPYGTHIDYSGIAEDVIYIPLDDFQTDLPQAGQIAEFVHKMMETGHNIICQCEKGQSRSAGCAAAILEHYYHSGQSVFDNDQYHPDEMVYYSVLDALDNCLGG